MEVKVCTKCKKELPATTEYFHRNRISHDGLRSDCKECKNKRYTRICEWCGQSFKSGSAQQRFCNKGCYYQYAKTDEYIEESQIKDIDVRTREFARRFEEDFPNFEYVSGYEDYLSIVEIKCRVCGHTQGRSAHTRISISCCGCGHTDCCNELAKERHRVWRGGYRILRDERLRRNGTPDYDLTLARLIERDRNICHICGGKCNSKDYVTRKNKYVVTGDTYPSMDHVLPISKGGTHTWDNVKLAHKICNSRKSDKLIYQQGNGQLTFSI